VIVNTSFNVRGEPIVCDPEDAFRCFMGTEMDMLVCGNAVLAKASQDPALAEDYKSKYELDSDPAYGSPIFTAARKASCGMSTLPNWRIFFLPAFCFSSSFFLRVTSPP